jgi:hypothetical protein
MQHHVHRQRQAELANHPRGLKLAGVGGSAGDSIGLRWVVGLEADLDAVQAGSLQFLGATACESDRTGD